MRKLRIVLKESKNISLLEGVFSGRENQFKEFKALEKMLQTSTDEKIKQSWNNIKSERSWTTGTPVGNDSLFVNFAKLIADSEEAVRIVASQSFIDSIKQTSPATKSFFGSYGSSDADTSRLDETQLVELIKAYYKASVLPFLYQEKEDKINSVDYAFGNYLQGLITQIRPRVQIVANAAKTVESRKTGFAAKIRTSLLGDYQDEFEQAVRQLANLFGNAISAFINRKKEADSLSVEIVGTGESPTTTAPTTTTPTPPEGAGGGGGEPPAPPPEGAGGGGGEPPPPAGTPSSRVIPISSGLYRDLTTGGIPRTVALEIVRALRADLERAGYTLRESLNTTKPTLTDILLREEYLYTSALYDLLLLEGAQADRESSYDREIRGLRSGVANLASGNNRKKKSQKIQSFKDLVDKIKQSYKNNEIRKDGVTSMIANINRAMNELGAEQIDLASVISSEPESPPSTPDASPAKEESPAEPETPEAAPEPSSDKSVDYWDQYFVKRYGTQLYRIQAMEALKAGNFKDFIDKYLKWVLNQKVDIEKKAGVKLSDISNIKEAVSDDEAEKKQKLADTKKYNTNLANFDKKTGGTFLKNYTNLINAIRKIKELSDLTGFNSPETAKELGDTKAIMQHIKAAFPKETGFNDDVHKKIFDLFTKYTKEKLKPYERGYKSAESNNLVKDLGKKKVIDQKNLAQFVKSLNGKTEADRAALKKINVQNVAVKTIKNFLSNYGIRLGENRYQAIANVLITESVKHHNLVREYHEHVNNNLLPYMQKQIGFNRPPTINFVDDPINAQNPFGKTAFYDPQLMEITVYTTGRHPKDIMRSVAHEVIHHAQNCRGQLDPQRMGEASEGYAQKNPYLRKLEEEAYLLGNMTFRDWEDGMKNKQLNEAHDCNKVHPNKSHAAYKRDDEAKNQEKPLDEWINEERWDLLMKRFKIVSEKRFANDPKLDKDGDGKPKWADEDDDDAEVNEKKLSKSETKEKERIVKGMKKSKEDFEERYPGRGKEVMYATATKKAMEKK